MSDFAVKIDRTTADGAPVSGPVPVAATRNACKLCSPLGAAMVFKGIRNCLPFLHGSQGCATYIRRYMISHFREPVDIASSSFSEDDAIFGGAENFATGIDNVISQYHPDVIGVATTCLSETIGENMIGMIRDYKERYAGEGPPLVHVSTPAYTGTHSDGYHAAIKAVLQEFVQPTGVSMRHQVNILPPMCSCADLRHLRELCEAYLLEATILPDYSDTLEGASWDAYHRISPGGTAVEDISEMSASGATIELGHSLTSHKESAGNWLEKKHGVTCESIGWPIGIRLSDEFFTTLSRLSGMRMPVAIEAERGRLVDAYVDAHKYISGKRAVIYGEPDLVIGLAAFLSETGIRPVLCATGSKVKNWKDLIGNEVEGGMDDIEALSVADHALIASKVRELEPDLMIGSSKGYPIAREMNIPLIRLGFPVHDRIGAQRQQTMGYRGTQQLFDQVVNALLEVRQDDSTSGFSYL